MRTLVIGDIHGGLRALVQLLERVQPKPEDHLIIFGRLRRWLERIGSNYRISHTTK